MVKKATNGESRILAEIAVQMWNSRTVDKLETKFVETLNDKQFSFFVKYINDLPVGFVQCGLRTDYFEGTGSSPVGYLEGIFVKKKSIARTDMKKNSFMLVKNRQKKRGAMSLPVIAS